MFLHVKKPSITNVDLATVFSGSCVWFLCTFFQDSQRFSRLNPRNGLVGLFVKIESEEDGGRYVVNASATAKKEGF